MAGSPSSERPPKEPATRDEKLKAALKANLQRRKAQARARAKKTEQGKAG